MCAWGRCPECDEHSCARVYLICCIPQLHPGINKIELKRSDCPRREPYDSLEGIIRIVPNRIGLMQQMLLPCMSHEALDPDYRNIESQIDRIYTIDPSRQVAHYNLAALFWVFTTIARDGHILHDEPWLVEFNRRCALLVSIGPVILSLLNPESLSRTVNIEKLAQWGTFQKSEQLSVEQIFGNRVSQRSY